MQFFRNAKNEKVRIDLTVKHLEDIRSGLTFRDGSPVDLYKISDEFNELFSSESPEFEYSPTLEKLISQPEILCQVLHVMLDCTFEDFAATINGGAIADATQALIRELIHFFFPLRKSVMIAAFEKLCELETKTDKQQAKLIKQTKFPDSRKSGT